MLRKFSLILQRKLRKKMSLTQIIGKVFVPRQRALEKHQNEGEQLQREVLSHLIQTAKDTEYGRHHAFAAVHGYDDFIKHVPVNTYEELKKDIDRMRHGETDILWPGRVKWYAKSSGTTNDKSKFIPVSPEGLQKIHYAGGRDSVAIYLRNNPKSAMFDGKGLILGGSHAPNYNLPDSLVGDLSAILIENINPLVNLVRVPKKQTALISDFEIKRERIAREAMNKNVTNISGVPSWMLSVLTCMMEITGKTHLEEVWPNIEIFFHGGVAFTPYREQYKRLITSPNMHYMETYNASEGFFGIQDDPTDKSMLLMLDYGVFYEFIPLDSRKEEGEKKNEPIPLWTVETGKNYAMVISTSCGLWRYEIGDTIQFALLGIDTGSRTGVETFVLLVHTGDYHFFDLLRLGLQSHFHVGFSRDCHSLVTQIRDDQRFLSIRNIQLELAIKVCYGTDSRTLHNDVGTDGAFSRLVEHDTRYPRLRPQTYRQEAHPD